MAVKMITAVPGSGKSLRAVELIFNYLKQGRQVYSNIDGLKISGVLDAPLNPCSLPPNSVVFYDEAQKHPIFARRNLIDDKQEMKDIRDKLYELNEHRHLGIDIYLITQNPRLIHQDVLAVVGEHYHLHRSFNLPAATIYLWREAKTNFSKSVKNEAEVTTTWKFPKHLYKFYESSVKHTHRTKIPLKYIVVLVLIFIALPIYLYFKFTSDPLLNHESIKQTPTSIAPINLIKPTTTSIEPIKPKIVETAPSEDERVAFVVSNGTDCVAKNSYGDLLYIPQSKCQMYSDKPSLIPSTRIKNELQSIQSSPLPQSSFSNQLNSQSSVSYIPPQYPNPL